MRSLKVPAARLLAISATITSPVSCRWHWRLPRSRQRQAPRPRRLSAAAKAAARRLSRQRRRSKSIRWIGPTGAARSRTRRPPEKGLVDKWNPKGGPESNLLWKRSDLGTRSTPIVMRGKLYVLVRDKPGTENEGEKVVCVDAATGEQMWEHRFNVYLTDVPDTRVGWSTSSAIRRRAASTPKASAATSAASKATRARWSGSTA